MVERDDNAAVATFYCPDAVVAGTRASLGEAAAHHARVKRLREGDRVRLSDGAGGRAVGYVVAVYKTSLDVSVERAHASAPQPTTHLRVPIGDRDRMLWLAEKSTELGIASWQGVRFRRSMSVSPRGDGQAFAAKVRARMISALEQSSGAWLPELLPDVAADSVGMVAGAQAILLDSTGSPLLSIVQANPMRPCVVLLGPEGGIEAAEHAALQAAGWRPARLGSTTLRFETAAIAALAVLGAVEVSSGR